MTDILIALASLAIILAGAIGSFLPVLPGPPLSFFGLWLYGWHTGYEKITPLVLVIFAVLSALTFVVDVISPALGAKGYKASRYGTLGSMLGAFLGIFVFGPIGIIIGPLIGGFAGEMIHAGNTDRAVKTAIGSFIGLVVGSIFKIAVIVGMLGYFIYALF